MSIEQGPKHNPKLETLSEDQEHLSRELFIHRFWKNYLYFQEFGKPLTLFQADLVRDKGEYTIKTLRTYSFGVFEVGLNKLKVRILNENGQIIDEFEISE